ncbi:outer membrane protein [Rickettsiella massiliensis]|uniref:outer membrane protein n=1 Tax=Rickettsiella massiliensis TaxID=676517 RepID=UPI00029A9D73|nr:hypothetical protein [Rickettsiella massiliensis]
MTIGSDRLCISYKSNKNIPACLAKKNICLGNNINLLINLLKKNCQNNVYYFDFGLGRTNNYFGSEINQIKKTPTVEGPDGFTPISTEKGSLFLISGGYIWRFNSLLFPTASVGLEYSYMPEISIRGNIYDLNDRDQPPGFIYQYNVSHTSLRLIGKMNLYCWKSFMPYVEIGVGGSWNYMNEYKEKTMEFPRMIPTTFQDSKKFAFSYSATIGIDYRSNQNFILSVGYRYDNFGLNETGLAIGQYKNNHLNETLNSNTLLLTGRYLFS